MHILIPNPGLRRFNTVFLFLKPISPMLIFCFFSFVAGAQEAEITVYSAKTYLGESFNFKDKKIVFKEVLEDSRCPDDVTCIWAGEAKILVEIVEGNKSLGTKIISLRSNAVTNAPGLASFFNEDVKIKFLSLSPYPKTSRKIKASDYQLKLKITENLEN